MISGLRGSGKTSMLGVLRELARESGWLVVNDDASSGLMARVMETTIPSIIAEQGEGARVRLKALNVWRFGAEFEYQGREREAKPLLRNDLLALSAALDNRGILITIDEVSSGRTRLKELSRFAREVSHALNEGANIVIAFAGVKIDLDELLKQEHTTFLRRSRELDFRRLSMPETRHVLKATTELGGRTVDEDALELLVAISQGYPYLVQLVGDYAWRKRPGDTVISVDDARDAHEKAVRAIERRVISRVYLDLSDVDQSFLQAMAIDEGRSKIADISRRMGTYQQYVQVYKQRLIGSGYVQTAGHGYVEFSLPIWATTFVRLCLVTTETTAGATAGTTFLHLLPLHDDEVPGTIRRTR